MTNYYSNPTSYGTYADAARAQFDDWVTQQSMSNLIRSLQQVNFASRADRNTGLMAIMNLVYATPYIINGNATAALGDRRFASVSNAATPLPNLAAIFIDLSCNGWQAVIQNLMSSLGFNNRPEEKTMLTDGSGEVETESVNAPNPQISRSQYNDAQQLFRFSLIKAKNLFSAGISAYNYLQFEAVYGLFFSTTPQNAIPVPELLLTYPDTPPSSPETRRKAKGPDTPPSSPETKRKTKNKHTTIEL